MEHTKQMIEIGSQYMMGTYSQFPIVFASGHGPYLVDVQGREYLDFVAGIAVNALGYGDPELSEALHHVVDSGLLHCSNLYWNPYAIQAAQLACTVSGMDKAFFCNSGAEANEAALKLARKFGHADGKQRTKIISMAHSFHGRTYGAVTATGQEKYHGGFEPLLADIVYAQYNDLQSVQDLVDEHTCAILLEPIQGEGGIVAADAQFLQGVRQVCDDNNLLLIFDEVQCGMGRTGFPFAWQYYGVQPDVLTVAKALSAGVPAGAMLARGVAATVFHPGDHASTFGGNALAMAGACVMLKRLESGSFLSHVQRMGHYLHEQLVALQGWYPDLVLDVRGVGLMAGLRLSIPPKEVVSQALEMGLLVASAGADVLRFVPPLIVNAQEIDQAVTIIGMILQKHHDQQC